MSLENLPNEKFAYSCIYLLIKNNALTDFNIKILCDGDECKRKFCCSSIFPILKEIRNDSKNELELTCYDNNKKLRYYKDVVVYQNRKFVITNYWYGPNKSHPDNRTPFMQWVLSEIAK